MEVGTLDVETKTLSWMDGLRLTKWSKLSREEMWPIYESLWSDSVGEIPHQEIERGILDIPPGVGAVELAVRKAHTKDGRAVFIIQHTSLGFAHELGWLPSGNPRESQLCLREGQDRPWRTCRLPNHRAIGALMQFFTNPAGLRHLPWGCRHG